MFRWSSDANRGGTSLPNNRVGPQVGYIFPVGKMQGYVNLKGYGEFANNDRPDGWNVWLTLSLSPAPPESTSSQKPMVTKQ